MFGAWSQTEKRRYTRYTVAFYRSELNTMRCEKHVFTDSLVSKNALLRDGVYGASVFRIYKNKNMYKCVVWKIEMYLNASDDDYFFFLDVEKQKYPPLPQQRHWISPNQQTKIRISNGL